MADLLTNQTTNAVGTPAAVSGPASVTYTADSVFGGAQVIIKVARNNVTAEFEAIGTRIPWAGSGGMGVNMQGDYFIVAELVNAGARSNVTIQI